MLDQLLEAWRTNNRINLFLIDHIDDDGMTCTLSRRGGRDVARQFAHMHNVRVWHLEKRAKDLARGLAPFPTKGTPARDDLASALTASGRKIETFLAGVLAGEARRRGFKKGVFATLGYFIAHESHHRGSIILTLKECGHPLVKQARDAIWGWDQI